MIPDGELRYMYREMFWDYNEYTIDGKINWDIIFYRIAFLSRIIKFPLSTERKLTGKCYLTFNSAEKLEEAFHRYLYSKEFIYWLLDEAIRSEFNEGIVVIEQKIARMNLNRTSIRTRFLL
jgi:hypothetical protein